MADLSKRQCTAIERVLAEIPDKSSARQYLRYARYKTKEHEKVELGSGAIVALVAALISFFLGGAGWSVIPLAIVAFFATVALVFFWHRISAAGEFHAHWKRQAESNSLSESGDAGQRTRRRVMLINRLEQLIKESPPVAPPWYAVHGDVEGLPGVARITAHRNQVLAFLEVHWPEAVERFERHGTRGLEELLAECLKEDDKTRPNIKGEITEVFDQWAVAVDQPADDESALEYFFTLNARIVNRTAVPTTLRFELWVQASHANCKTNHSSLANLLIKRTRHGTGLMVGISQVESIIEEMPHLELLCKTPLTMGDEREGWLRFVLPRANNPIRKDIESLTLVVKDSYDQEHRIFCPRSQWRKEGELVTRFKVEIEQERVKELDAKSGL
jgi:hypothetical protein